MRAKEQRKKEDQTQLGTDEHPEGQMTEKMPCKALGADRQELGVCRNGRDIRIVSMRDCVSKRADNMKGEAMWRQVRRTRH